MKTKWKRILPGPAWELLRKSRSKLLGYRETSRVSSGRTTWCEWSIGIYSGDSPLLLAPAEGVANPVLTAAHVSDAPAGFVADPFMIKVGPRWHMFFEVWNRCSGKGEIGLAVSPNAKAWDYHKIVLAEPFHLSYPHVFAWDGECYMLPETFAANSIRLYKATRFPVKWAFVRTLVDGRDYVDPSIFHANGRWWLFAGTGAPPCRANDLHLFYAEDLLGPWRHHEKSPVVRNNIRIARPGGRVLVHGGRLIRYAQDCDGGYGLRVRALEITELTPKDYLERELPASPILAGSGAGWNATGMHQIDPYHLGDGRWIACVDGQVVHEDDGSPS